MPDISDINSAQSTKIIGSDSDGTEQTPVRSTNTGKLQTSDFSDNGGVHGALNVSTTPVEAKVGSTPLANRKNLTIYNNSNSGRTLYWGYSNAVTPNTGTPLIRDALLTLNVGPNTRVWIVFAQGTENVRITESA